MGLARVVYGGISIASKGLRELAATLGISPEEAVEGVSLILDNWRRNRILYVVGDPVYSRYHAKDDPYIQAGLCRCVNSAPRACCLTLTSRTTTPAA